MANTKNGKCKNEQKERGNKPRSNGRNSNPMRKQNGAKGNGAVESKSNPVSFYTKYTQFAHDAARIPFARVVGARYDIDFISNAGSGNKFYYEDPGIMRICFTPSIGVSNDATSPLNRSSVNFYGRLVSTQKAFKDYDHQDLTMMMLAIDSCIMFHALGRKIYGVLSDMTPVNRYYPKALVAACGVQFTDTQKNIQDFRAWLNEFALQIEQYTLPDNIELFKRHQWMCEGLYTDSESKRAQTYMFVPSGFWQYDNTASTGSRLVWKQYIVPGETSNTSYTLKEFMEFGDSLIKAISNDNDFSNISGDLYAYYDGKAFSLPYIDERYQILPKYDKSVLSQIENATICGWWASDYTPVISQDPSVNQGSIIFQPRMQVQGTFVPNTHTMNFHWDSPTEDDVIEATRLMASFQTSVDSKGGVGLSMSSTEIVNALDIIVTDPNTMGVKMRRLQQPIYSVVTSDTALTLNLINDILWLNKFDWAPQVHVVDRTGEWGLNSYMGTTWDIDNSTVIPNNYLDTINTACLYSLFNVETR